MMPSAPSVKRATEELHPAAKPPIRTNAAPRASRRSNVPRTLFCIANTREIPATDPDIKAS